jgi:RNA polymerase sigma factor (sigma-70 family)
VVPHVGRSEVAPELDAKSHAPQAMGDPPPEYVDFFRVHYRRLMRVAMYAGATEQEAHDVVQDALLKVLRRWHMIEDPVSYARTAVINNVRQIKRSERSRQSRQNTYLVQNFERPSDDPSVWDDDEGVEAMLRELTPGQREIVRLLLRTLTPAEVAETLGRSYDAVRSALSDMRRRLRAAGYKPRPPATRSRGDRDSLPPTREEDR